MFNYLAGRADFDPNLKTHGVTVNKARAQVPLLHLAVLKATIEGPGLHSGVSMLRRLLTFRLVLSLSPKKKPPLKTVHWESNLLCGFLSGCG